LHGDLRAGIGLCERAVEVARRANDAYATGFCLYNLGILVHNRADFDAALALWEEAARIAPPGWSAAVNHVIAREWLRRGDVAKARGLAEHGLRLAREYRFPISTMWTLHALTDIAMAGGDYALARASAEEQVAIARRIGERLQGQGLGLAKMAAADAALGNLDGAAVSIAEAAAIFEEQDARAWAGEARFALGLVQDASGDADAARASYAAAAELCRAVGHEPCAAACEAALAGGSAADATGFMLSDWPRWIAAPA
jgi:tetratricopeptide (TPR) repeat protein